MSEFTRFQDQIRRKGRVDQDRLRGYSLLRVQSLVRVQCFWESNSKIFCFQSSYVWAYLSQRQSYCLRCVCILFGGRNPRVDQFMKSRFLLSRFRMPTATRTLRASQTLLLRLRLFLAFCSEDSCTCPLFWWCLERSMLARSLQEADFLTLSISLISSERSFSPPTSLFCTSSPLISSLSSYLYPSSFFPPLLNSGDLNIKLPSNPGSSSNLCGVSFWKYRHLSLNILPSLFSCLLVLERNK